MDPRSCSASHRTPHQTLLHNSDGAMLSRLSRLLVFWSLYLAMMGIHTNGQSNEENDPFADYYTMFNSDPVGTSQFPANPLPIPNMGGGHGPINGSAFSQVRMMDTSDPSVTGIPDMAICSMLINDDLPTPVDQIPLYCFCSHCKGKVGPKGDRGDRGPPGDPGRPGRRGRTGFIGHPGFTGPQGIKGHKGDLGEKGRLGADGSIGAKGERGFKGDKGDGGQIGFAGAEGPQGEAGTCPASCDSVQGLPGPQGRPGSPGARGLPGVMGMMGFRGHKGDKGDLGGTGDPGMRGRKGDQGEQGMCDCTDGADGKDGTPGGEGAKGDKGDTGEHGVQGIMGLSGDKGDMGFHGMPGPCSTAIQSAFSACVNDSYPVHNQPVPFSHVLTNQLGHFNPFSGIYTAPVNGTYVFSFHLVVRKRVLKVGLFHNFNSVVKNIGATDHSTTSQTVILHLSAGDRMWLQVKDATTNGLYTDKESSSTFSGYLMFPDTCDLDEIHRRLPMTGNDENEEEFDWFGPEGNTTPPP